MDWVKRLFGGRAAAPPPVQQAAAQERAASADELKAAMTTVANRDTPANRRALYETLLQAELMLPTPREDAPDPPQRRVAGQSEQIQLVVVKDNEGNTVWPAFTDEQALVKWEPDGSAYIQMNARAVFQMMVASDTDRIVLNPGSVPAGFVTRHEAAILAEGNIPVPESQQMTRVHLTRDTPVLIGSPSTAPPPQLIERIRERVELYDAVESAYLFVMGVDGAAPHLTLGLRLWTQIDERAFAEMSETIGKAAVAELPKDAYLDMIVLDDALLQRIEKAVPAIYTRSDA